jgi:hypothetical protein
MIALYDVTVEDAYDVDLLWSYKIVRLLNSPSSRKPLYFLLNRKDNTLIVDINLSVCLAKALQPFVGPWPLFQFLDLLQSR